MMLTVPLPVPLRSSFYGLPSALSLMRTSPDRVPPEVGVNVTFIVQEAPGCKVPSQLQVPQSTRRYRRGNRLFMWTSF